MTPAVIPFAAGEARLDWLALAAALEAGHALPAAESRESYIRPDGNTIITLTAWIEGLGVAVKSAHVFPGNEARSLPAINGGVCLYEDGTGILQAVIDFHLVTKWKTAADSLLAAQKLARTDARRILIVGAGTVARSMVEAYGALFPEARVAVWNRSAARAEALAADYPGVGIARDLEPAVREADIISCATMTRAPLIRGAWLRPGQHLDLIGAYLPDMREADDEAMRRGRIFVDRREGAMENIGELTLPIASGAIAPGDILADFYDLPSGRFARGSDDEITVFKNGGGGHLDLMAARHILQEWQSAGG